MAENATGLAPVRGTARIEVLDVLRGLAILGIFYMNIPFMGAPIMPAINDFRSIGWSDADRWAWIATVTFAEGTQRGMLEMLFGAGMMVLTRRAMDPLGPVAVADLYYRRNLWLLAFGLVDIFLFLWPGDILHVYALAALFTFPFRRLAPKWLLAIGLAFATFIAVTGTIDYVGRIGLEKTVVAAKAHAAQGVPLTKAEKDATAEWQKKIDRRKVTAEEKKRFAEERRAHDDGGLLAYAQWAWGGWIMLATVKQSVFFGVIEAFGVMLIGVALWKWGVIQGQRSRRFYVGLMLIAYGFGLTSRFVGALEVIPGLPQPKQIWITQEYARIAVALGHVALINWLFQTRAGAAMLSPFRAAGRFAFSLYFLETIIGLWIVFAPWGPGLWGRYSYAGLSVIATLVIAGLVIVANLWGQRFAMGPMEWAWRSLAYLERQPFLKRRPAQSVEPDPGAILPA